MRNLRFSAYLFIAVILIAGIFMLITSYRKSSEKYILKNQDTNILVYPERYRYYEEKKTSEPELKGKAVFFNLSDVWTEFIPGLYIHSAFADIKRNVSDTTQIRIIGIGQKLNLNKNSIKCLLQNNNTFWEESSSNLIKNYHQSFMYFTVLCISKHSTKPIKVALSHPHFLNKTHWLEVHYKSPKKLAEHQITVCAPPLPQSFDDMQLLAEYLSYYDTTGVSSFVFYDNNMIRSVKNFINMTSYYGINITIVPWTIPADTVFAMGRVLKLASIHHCIFLNRGISKYVLPINIDQFLVPRQHFSLPELMDELSTVTKRNIGSYVFRQSYFCKQNVTMGRKEDIQLASATDVFREEMIWPAKKKSKYMVHPDSVAEGGLYYVLKHRKGWISANVPWQLAMIHHYTLCSRKKKISKLIEDRTAESFKYEILLSKPMTAYRKFKDLIK